MTGERVQTAKVTQWTLSIPSVYYVCTNFTLPILDTSMLKKAVVHHMRMYNAAGTGHNSEYWNRRAMENQYIPKM